MEINSQSLSSKYFGESGKLVSKMIENIETMLDEDDEAFVCVFIDEVETLTAKREHAVQGKEPHDAMRAVNALLTGLNRLRHRANVVVLCTSNLIAALDSAFLDRVDIKQHVPRPSVRIIYEIYRSCLTDLGQAGLIQGVCYKVVPYDPKDKESPMVHREYPCENLELPSYDEMALHYWCFPDSTPRRLALIAETSVVSIHP